MRRYLTKLFKRRPAVDGDRWGGRWSEHTGNTDRMAWLREQTRDKMEWTVEPTKAEWDALVDAVGRCVVFPSFREEIAQTGDILTWAQQRGMGVDLAEFFVRCFSEPQMQDAVENIDRTRKMLGIETAEPWRDES